MEPVVVSAAQSSTDIVRRVATHVRADTRGNAGVLRMRMVIEARRARSCASLSVQSDELRDGGTRTRAVLRATSERPAKPSVQ